ncbi:MAG: class A beta-lactamase-related serine hydrolase [Gemmatimonadetes bacterium]|nr:class A beta-lactamase-related serine hydrolase [Gemmatimonadota bacterium]
MLEHSPPGVLLAAVVFAVVSTACGAGGRGKDLTQLADSLRARIAASGAEVGLYYRSLGGADDSVAIDADVRMHAASTMKVPVMMQLYLDQEAGLRSLDDSLVITRTFHSIVDGSTFELPRESDSDTTYYGRVGDRVAVRDLVDRMITWSSNLATNILIETVDPKRVTATLRELGADSMNVLRGVEDLKAFDAGLNNTATARDLGVVMAAVATSPRFSETAREAMLATLEHQHFRENIPAGLPEETRVANKTGWITGHNHDAAVVFPKHGPPYVLVVMTRGIEDQRTAALLVADLSRMVWDYHAHGHGSGDGA